MPEDEDVFRFTSTLIRRTLPKMRGKPAPSSGSIRNALSLLIPWLKESYKGFERNWTQHITLRIRTLIDNKEKEGLLTRGRWRKRQWLGFNMVLKMCTAYVTSAIEDGCVSWDIVVHRWLSIVLMCSLGSRSGDIARSSRYQGLECLLLEHITLTLEGGDKFHNLEASVELAFTKTNKYVSHRPLRTSSN